MASADLRLSNLALLRIGEDVVLMEALGSCRGPNGKFETWVQVTSRMEIEEEEEEKVKEGPFGVCHWEQHFA